MQTGNPGVKCGLFPGLHDNFIHRFLFIFQHFFNMRRMDTPIQDQFRQGTPGDFATDRLEAGDGHGFGGIIHDNVHPGSLLKGTDVPSVASYNAAFHFFVRQRHEGSGEFRHIFCCNPLDGIGNELAGTFLALFTGLGLNLPDDAGHVITRIFFDFGQKDTARLLGVHLGHTLEF